MKGLQVTSTPPRITAPRDSSATSNTPPIPRALTPIPPPRERAASSAPSSQSGTPRSRLRTPPPHPPPWISPSTTSVADHNPSIPGNLYLIPSAGAVFWSETKDGDDAAMDANRPGAENPLWTRGGDDWWPAARKLRAAVDALPDAFDAVFADTDHLAACVLTKLALAACHSVVVPLSFDDGDFNRLFQDVTGNTLMTDVMPPMDAKGLLRARATGAARATS